MKEVVIASACRTAIGAFGGSLKNLNGAVLASITMREAVKRAGIDPSIIDDVRYGCCLEHHDTLNTTRVAALMAGIPDTVPAATINRVCISGMEAVLSGMAMIQAGMADVILAGGVEHMSGVPYSVAAARWGCRLQDHEFVDNIIRGLHCGSHVMPHPEDGPVDAEKAPLSYFKGKPYIMGQTAEAVAQLLSISREEMDEVALRSHNNTERATQNGSFKAEIVPVEVPQRRGDPLLIDEAQRLPRSIRRRVDRTGWRCHNDIRPSGLRQRIPGYPLKFQGIGRILTWTTRRRAWYLFCVSRGWGEYVGLPRVLL